MGILKFEIEIPDFDKELNINLTLKKDGTVIESYNEKSSNIIPPPSKEVLPKVEKKENNITPGTSKIGGNMMNIDF